MFPGYFLWRMFSRFARAYLPILFNFAFIEASSMLYIEIFLRWFTTTFLELFCINRLRNWLIVFHLLFLFLLLLVIYFIYIMCIPFSKFLVISALVKFQNVKLIKTYRMYKYFPTVCFDRWLTKIYSSEASSGTYNKPSSNNKRYTYNNAVTMYNKSNGW